ncbi:MAG: 2-C-methyl-D-erythritol 2,4-cyclodiphosphate synthase [Corynebacterium matruchotii]
MNIRIGQGYDVHQLVEGRDLILGGVHIPFEKGLLGHSDADALLHALTDALLGAAGLGDIGSHFPDTAAEFKDADSRVLLREAYQSVQALGWRVVNVDTTVIAQKPKLAPHIPSMRANIAADLGLQTACHYGQAFQRHTSTNQPCLSSAKPYWMSVKALRKA